MQQSIPAGDAEAHRWSRIRKVKCDEGRPACRRCVSTGRVCDGYGVWGGGGTPYGHRQQTIVVSTDGTVAPTPTASIPILAAGAEERDYFEWFKCRTATKIPGIFVLSFWDTLLIQACSSQPAVWHAVLTLSAVHKGNTGGVSGRSRHHAIDEQERFMLQQYTKAISRLQPHFSNQDRSSVRIALITCMVFICLECLRGRFKTAQTHLRNGLMILRETQSSLNLNDKGPLFLKPSRESVDDWITEAFCRLHVQVSLFNQSYRHSCLIMQGSRGPEPHVQIYLSFNET